MKKTNCCKTIILIFMLFVGSLFFGSDFVFADNIQNSSTYSYPVYNEFSSYYQDLNGITSLDINSKYLVYSNGTSSNVLNVLKIQSKEQFTFGTFDSIKYVKLIDKYIFVVHGNTSLQLSIYAIDHQQPINLITANGNNYILPNCASICIREIKNSTSGVSQIVIATTNVANNSVAISWFDLKTFTQTNACPYLAINETISKITLSNEKIYVICSENLYSINLSSFPSATTKADFQNNYFPTGSIISLDYIEVNSTNYLIATTSNCLNLIETNLTVGQTGNTIKIGENSDDAMALGIIKNPIDVKVFNNFIYVADSTSKSIQCFSIASDASAFRAENILVSSNCKDKGWFNHNSQLFVTDDNTIVSTYSNDAGNKNRIQIISNSNIISPSHFDDSVYSNFSNAKISDTHLIFTSTKNTDEGALFIYQYDKVNNSLTQPSSAVFSKNINSELSNMSTIRDFVIVNNTIYAIDGNNLLMMTYRGTSAGGTMSSIKSVGDENFITDSDISADAKMCYLQNSQVLAIYSNDKVYIVSLNGTLLNTISYETNCYSICSDKNDNVYILSEISSKRTIQKFSYSINNEFQNIVSINSDDNPTIANLTTITIQNESGIIFGFDNINCCPVTIFNPDFNIFSNPSIVITINQKVSFYNSPILENGENNCNIKKTLPINCTINVYSIFPITYNQRQFYIVKNSDNTFSYINKADVVTDSEDYIKTLLVPNAKIKILDDSQFVYVYDNKEFEGDSIDSLVNGKDIFILETNKEGNYAFIKYYDDLQVEHNGYIHLIYVKTNGMTQTQIIILILLICTLVLGLVLGVFFYKIKHPRTRV